MVSVKIEQSSQSCQTKNRAHVAFRQSAGPGKSSGVYYGLVHLGFDGLHIGIGPPSDGSKGAVTAEHAPTTPTISINTLIAYFIEVLVLLMQVPWEREPDKRILTTITLVTLQYLLVGYLAELSADKSAFRSHNSLSLR